VNNLESRFKPESMPLLSALDNLLNPARLPDQKSAEFQSHGERDVAVVQDVFNPKAESKANAESTAKAMPKRKASKPKPIDLMDLSDEDDKFDVSKLAELFKGTELLLPLSKLGQELPLFRNWVQSQKSKFQQTEEARVADVKRKLALHDVTAMDIDSGDGKSAKADGKSGQVDGKAAKADSKAPKSANGAVLDDVLGELAADEEPEVVDSSSDEEPEAEEAPKKARLSKREKERAALEQLAKPRAFSLRALCETLIAGHETYDAIFPAFIALAHLTLALPLHSADCERGFSLLKLIKTYLRNRLINATLLPLMLIACEGPAMDDKEFDKLIEDSIDNWTQQKTRRQQV